MRVERLGYTRKNDVICDPCSSNAFICRRKKRKKRGKGGEPRYNFRRGEKSR